MESGLKPINRTTSMEVLQGKYQLGRGSFAKVYYAQSLVDGTSVAIKVIDKTNIVNTTMEPRFIREVSVMRRLQHPNIIRIHEVMATWNKIFLVMEYARGGELFSNISRRRRLSEPIARRYFQQLVVALHFCHNSGALPEQLKDGLLHTACGTPAYTTPEVVGRRGYDGAKADAWSCGVLLFVFLAGFLPFDDSNLTVMHRKIHRKEFQFPSWFSKPVRWVISRLLDPNPETRISIHDLMEVAWVKKSFQSIGCKSQLDLEKLLMGNHTPFQSMVRVLKWNQEKRALEKQDAEEEERKLTLDRSGAAAGWRRAAGGLGVGDEQISPVWGEGELP
ncbi:hypothetical protein HHK36_016770 [Tetracentron sinense]|uniref:Protein kinase domain-containing protein n=1 Tax=Tetracentron sinense TaxID=13715 RepID=A0A834Z1X8_TETSI|nr:hypothetical protein HHK36_016770 [Tetracentron sinense]